MEMRIVVPDAPSATALAQQLRLALGTEQIRLRDRPGVVDILIDPAPTAGLAGVLEAVVRWFDYARAATVELWLGDRSYRLARWTPVGTR
jgi:hypothetical protein